MRKHFSKTARFLWATGVGGIFFLLPLAVALYLLGQVFAMVWAVAQPLQEWVPVYSPIGIALIFLASLAILIFTCFAAGVIATRAIGRRLSKTIENQLIMVFPKYAIYKDLLAGNLNPDSAGPTLTPVLVEVPEGFRLAFESERLDGGWVVVYSPGAPDAWIGSILLVPSERIRPCPIPFNDAVGIFERLGRESSSLFGNLSAASSLEPTENQAHGRAEASSTPRTQRCGKSQSG